jgi:uncharacterized protein YbjT (DUF2867 family)
LRRPAPTGPDRLGPYAADDKDEEIDMSGHAPKILVTGATGNVGRLVVDRLLEAGATNVRALTVNPAKAALPAGVEVVEGYLGRLASMPRALDGVEILYLAPLPHTAAEVLELARAAGVRRVVDLSSSDADTEAAGDPSGWHYYAVEKATEESGLPWTHLRPGEFMNNTLGWADQIRRTGMVRAAYGEAASTVIDLGDIAAVAARVLLDEGHVGKKYLMSGPEAIKRRELVRLIGVAIGRDVRFEELTYDEALADLSKTMGEYAAWYLEGMDRLIEHPQEPARTTEEITGRPGTTFAQWAVRNADAFR